jgi:hypothetical protein
MANDTVFTYPPKPDVFIRVTDNQTAIKFGCYGDEPTKDVIGFDVGYSTRFIELCHRLTPYSVRCHLEFSPLCEWKGLISVCGTSKKAGREIEWRARQKRRDITAFHISTAKLRWTTLNLTSTTKINALANGDYNEPVIFIKATELIQVLGLRGNIKEAAEYGAKDEWFALEWIPLDMIESATRYG